MSKTNISLHFEQNRDSEDGPLGGGYYLDMYMNDPKELKSLRVSIMKKSKDAHASPISEVHNKKMRKELGIFSCVISFGEGWDKNKDYILVKPVLDYLKKKNYRVVTK